MSWDLIMSLQLPRPSWRCLCKGRAARICNYSHSRDVLQCVIITAALAVCVVWRPLGSGVRQSTRNSSYEQQRLSPACAWQNGWHIPPSCLWWQCEEVPRDCVGDGDAREEMRGAPGDAGRWCGSVRTPRPTPEQVGNKWRLVRLCKSSMFWVCWINGIVD